MIPNGNYAPNWLEGFEADDAILDYHQKLKSDVKIDLKANYFVKVDSQEYRFNSLGSFLTLDVKSLKDQFYKGFNIRAGDLLNIYPTGEIHTIVCHQDMEYHRTELFTGDSIAFFWSGNLHFIKPKRDHANMKGRQVKGVSRPAKDHLAFFKDESISYLRTAEILSIAGLEIGGDKDVFNYRDGGVNVIKLLSNQKIPGIDHELNGWLYFTENQDFISYKLSKSVVQGDIKIPAKSSVTENLRKEIVFVNPSEPVLYRAKVKLKGFFFINELNEVNRFLVMTPNDTLISGLRVFDDVQITTNGLLLSGTLSKDTVIKDNHLHKYTRILRSASNRLLFSQADTLTGVYTIPQLNVRQFLEAVLSKIRDKSIEVLSEHGRLNTEVRGRDIILDRNKVVLQIGIFTEDRIEMPIEDCDLLVDLKVTIEINNSRLYRSKAVISVSTLEAKFTTYSFICGLTAQIGYLINQDIWDNAIQKVKPQVVDITLYRKIIETKLILENSNYYYLRLKDLFIEDENFKISYEYNTIVDHNISLN